MNRDIYCYYVATSVVEFDGTDMFETDGLAIDATIRSEKITECGHICDTISIIPCNLEGEFAVTM